MSHSKEVSCLSVRQPWADLLCRGVKNIENRTWRLALKHWGKRLYIHAATHYDFQGATWIVETFGHMAEWPEIARCLRDSRKRVGGIVGSVVFDRVVEQSDSPWAQQGQLHFVVNTEHSVFLPQIIPAKGKLLIWSFDLPVTED